MCEEKILSQAESLQGRSDCICKVYCGVVSELGGLTERGVQFAAGPLDIALVFR